MEQLGTHKYKLDGIADNWFEIGGTDKFSPVVSMKRWNGERTLELEPALILPDAKLLSSVGDLIYTNDDLGFKWKAIQGEMGGVAIDTIFHKRPPFNKLTFNINATGLKFIYQPALTAKEIAEGYRRPDNVVGSYVVKHDTRGALHRTVAEANRYRTGKWGHIYRPLLIDALGHRAWGVLEITGTLLTIHIDPVWLDNAVYPVVLDPDFGYDTIGGSTNDWPGTRIRGSVQTTPGDMDTLDSITIYCDAYSAGKNVKGVIVLHSNLNIVANGVGGGSFVSEAPGWVTSTMGTPPTLTASTPYVIMFVHNTDDVIYWYDTGDADQDHYDSSNSYDTPTNPTDAAHSTMEWSAYGTYTAEAGGVTVTPPALALTLTEYAPIMKHQVIVPVLALSVTQYAPVIKLGIIPSTLVLSLATYAPVIGLKIIPSVLALSITLYVPTIAVGVYVVPSTLALSLTEYAAVISTPRLVTPGVLALLITEYGPIITVASVVSIAAVEQYISALAGRRLTRFDRGKV